MKSWFYSSICACAMVAGFAVTADAERRPICEVKCMTEVSTFAQRNSSPDSFIEDDDIPAYFSGARFCEMANTNTDLRQRVRQACLECMRKCQGH